MTPRTVKHNPAFLAENELVESFVVRTRELGQLEEILRENIGARSNQHVLVTGPRGAGKSTLLHRLAIAVRRDESLAGAWFPILLPEETYQVTSIGDLWLEVLRRLGDATEEVRWRDAYSTLVRDSNRAHGGEMALLRILDFAHERQLRVMLVIENLDAVLGEQLSQDDGWKLRHSLQNQPSIMLAGSAVRGTDVLADDRSATFEMFRTLELRPLDVPECIALWKSVTGRDEVPAMGRPLQILTGGNPRLLAILASFGREQSLLRIMRDLDQLADDHTAYFKSIIESMPPQGRKVFVTLAGLWEPSSSRQVGEQAGLDVNTVSTQLVRLCDRGLVHEVREIGRVKLYELSERMFNIYHLLRSHGRGRERVRAVVEFMVQWYGNEALPGVAAQILAEAGQVNDASDHAYVLAALCERVSGLAESLGTAENNAWARLGPLLESVTVASGRKRSRRDEDLRALTTALATHVDADTPQDQLLRAESALASHPDDVDFLAIYAHAAIRAKKRDSTFQAVLRVEELDSWSPIARFLVGYARVLAGRGLRLAIEHLSNLASFGEFASLAAFYRGIAHWKLGESDEALAALRGCGPGEKKEARELARIVAEAKQLGWASWRRAVRDCDDEREIIEFARGWLAMNGDGLPATVQMIRESWRPELRCLAPYLPEWIDDALWKAETSHERLDVLAAAAGSVMPEDQWPRIITTFRDVLASTPGGDEVLRLTTEFLTLTAAAGRAKLALDAVRGSSVAALLEPVVVALRWASGETVDAPHEVAEIARDVTKHLEHLRESRRRAAATVRSPPSPTPKREAPRKSPKRGRKRT